MNDFPAEFYSVAAQIIAVLFIVMAIEYRLVTRSDQTDTGARAASDDEGEDEGTADESEDDLIRDFITMLGVIITCTIGEYAALATLSEQRTTDARHTAVWLTLAVQAAALALFPLYFQLLRLADRHIRGMQRVQAQIETRTRRIHDRLDAVGAEIESAQGRPFHPGERERQNDILTTTKRETKKELRHVRWQSIRLQVRLWLRTAPLVRLALPAVLAVTPVYWIAVQVL